MDKQKKIYKLEEAVKIVKQQDFKHVQLCELDGSALVNWNVVAKPVKPKLEEIQRRWSTLSDGLYVMNCKTVYGGKAKAFPMYVGKGVYDDNVLDAAASTEKKEERQKLSDVNVLSYEQALDKASQINKLEFQVKELQRELDEVKKERDELLADVESLEESSEEEKPMSDLGANVKEWLTDISTTLAPLADRYFSMKEKQISLEQVKVLSQAGYEIPGAGKRNPMRTGKPVIDYNKNIPEPDSAAWPSYIDWVCALQDAEFEAHLDKLKATDEGLYKRVESEVLEGDGNE